MNFIFNVLIISVEQTSIITLHTVKLAQISCNYNELKVGFILNFYNKWYGNYGMSHV